MSSIKSFIEGYMTGNAWEDLCVRCYRIRYQKDNYTAIPATQGGDAGIEGFTYKGVVHQCYCPERDYSDNELGYGLIKRQQNAKYKLTDRGKQLAEQIKVVGDLMVIEIGDLNLLAKKLTERKVEEIVDRWRIKDAENQ